MGIKFKVALKLFANLLNLTAKFIKNQNKISLMEVNLLILNLKQLIKLAANLPNLASLNFKKQFQDKFVEIKFNPSFHTKAKPEKFQNLNLNSSKSFWRNLQAR